MHSVSWHIRAAYVTWVQAAGSEVGALVTDEPGEPGTVQLGPAEEHRYYHI